MTQTWFPIATSCVGQSLLNSLQFVSGVVPSLNRFTSLHKESLRNHCCPHSSPSLDVPSWSTEYRLRLNHFTSLHYYYSPQSCSSLDVPSWSTGHRLVLWGYEHRSFTITSADFTVLLVSHGSRAPHSATNVDHSVVPT